MCRLMFFIANMDTEQKVALWVISHCVVGEKRNE